MQFANRSLQQECQELKMRLKNSENDRGALKNHYCGDPGDTSSTNTKPTNVKNEEKLCNEMRDATLIRLKFLEEENRDLNLQLQAAKETNEQNLTKYSEILMMMMEEKLQHQKLKTRSAEYRLAFEKVLRQMVFKLTNPAKDVSPSKEPCEAPTLPLDTFKALPSQDLCGRPTKTKDASPDLTDVLATATGLTVENQTPATTKSEKTTEEEESTEQDQGPQRFSKPVTHQDGRRWSCFPFKKLFRKSKFFRKSSKKDPVVNVCPPGTPDAPHLGVDSL